jgi:methylated-DNA-[protein]-cysteine S-methyltransferase
MGVMRRMLELFSDRVESPIGTLLIISDGTRLRSLDYRGYDHRMNRLLVARFGEYTLRESTDPGGATSALRAYLAGDLAALEALPVDTAGTPFQETVWAELRRIPAGTTITYGEQARRLGLPLTASRAVGHANSLNPVAIVLPCHRVIGAGAKLTGYAGGLHRKRWLLEHEGVAVEPDAPKRDERQLSLLG